VNRDKAALRNQRASPVANALGACACVKGGGKKKRKIQHNKLSHYRNEAEDSHGGSGGLLISAYLYRSHDARVNHSDIVTAVLISRARGREYKSRAARLEQSGKSLKPVNASIVSSRLTFNSDIPFSRRQKRLHCRCRRPGRVSRNQPRISNERRLLAARSAIARPCDRPNPRRRTRSNASRFIARLLGTASPMRGILFASPFPVLYPFALSLSRARARALFPLPQAPRGTPRLSSSAGN